MVSLMSSQSRRMVATQRSARAPALGSAGHASARRGATTIVRASSELKKPELRRPEAPKVAAEAPKHFEDAGAAASSAPVVPIEPTVASSSKVMTVEYQRLRAKEMTKYFKQLKLQEVTQKAQVFGWTPANEISNGRWVMFGFAVGLLTEYATGVDFPAQFKLMATYLGIADLE